MTEEVVSERDPQTEERETQAERYFEHDLGGQRRWYSDKATRFKERARLLGAAIIAAGAATAFVQVFGEAPWVSVLTALLGALVALAEGWRQIARYDETWAAYRIAGERMKRERRLYVNGAGEYRQLTDEDEAFLRFIENIEAIIAEEQQIYWQNRGTEAVVRKSPASGDALADGGGHGRP